MWKNWKLSLLPENWHLWYIGGADSKSTLRFFKFRPKIHFWANLGQKSESCLFCMKIGTHTHTQYLKDDHSYFNISFLNFQPYIHFWANLGPKSQSCLFCLKMDTQSMVRMLILIPILIFWISNPKSFFSQIWAEKVKIIMFMILFLPDGLHCCNLGHCATYVVFMSCELVIL